MARIEERGCAQKILMGKPEGKGLLERPKSRLEDNIQMDLKQTGWNGVNWSDLAQNRYKVAGSYENGNENSHFQKEMRRNF